MEYDECTEEQCIVMIQEMLQVENVFHLQVLGEGDDTQLSLSWRTLDEKKTEEEATVSRTRRRSLAEVEKNGASADTAVSTKTSDLESSRRSLLLL